MHNIYTNFKINSKSNRIIKNQNLIQNIYKQNCYKTRLFKSIGNHQLLENLNSDLDNIRLKTISPQASRKLKNISVL